MDYSSVKSTPFDALLISAYVVVIVICLLVITSKNVGF